MTLVRAGQHSVRADLVETEPMKRICSWCDAVMSEGTEPATHGICVPCSQKFVGRPGS